MLYLRPKIRVCKICLVSPQLERLLLLTYLILFPILVKLVSYEVMPPLDNYAVKSNLMQFFKKESILNAQR
jgi:hypothetical protein